MSATTTNGKAPNREAKKQRPAFEARYGRLKVTVWRQESDKGPWFNVVLSRGYKDESGQWQTANTFGVRDLLEVSKLCTEAHSWIHRELAKAHQQNGQDDDHESGANDDIPY
jgi:hypothetical protein